MALVPVIIPLVANALMTKKEFKINMREMDKQYPGYGLADHKGYPTKVHMDALDKLGVTPIHRTSYAPVRAKIEQKLVDANRRMCNLLFYVN